MGEQLPIKPVDIIKLKRENVMHEVRVAVLQAEVGRLRATLEEAAPILTTIAGELEPYRDEDGWGVGVTNEDIVVWSSLSAVADNLALALEPAP